MEGDVESDEHRALPGVYVVGLVGVAAIARRPRTIPAAGVDHWLRSSGTRIRYGRPKAATANDRATATKNLFPADVASHSGFARRGTTTDSITAIIQLVRMVFNLKAWASSFSP
ncbi:hypothetical protein ABW21_db0205366 [Orbilia brochopaga]|nr:hypothetical protein ABW21_db0205366 [Drechslerella brochopaga]